MLDIKVDTRNSYLVYFQPFSLDEVIELSNSDFLVLILILILSRLYKTNLLILSDMYIMDCENVKDHGQLFGFQITHILIF